MSFEDYHKFHHQQNEVGEKQCFPCEFSRTRKLAELIDSKYLLSEFTGLRSTRATGLPAEASTPRALLVEVQSMPADAVFRLIITSQTLSRKFTERKWCLEEAKEQGLAAHTAAQIEFFANLWVAVEGKHWQQNFNEGDEEQCCEAKKFEVFCGEALIMTYDMSENKILKRELDCILDIAEDKFNYPLLSFPFLY